MKAGIKATIKDMEAYPGELDPHVESYMAEDRLRAVREEVNARLNLGPDSEWYPFLSLVDGDLEKRWRIRRSGWLLASCERHCWRRPCSTKQRTCMKKRSESFVGVF